jgi:hypothetical protein
MSEENMAIGFVVAMGAYHALRRWGTGKRYIGWMLQ